MRLLLLLLQQRLCRLGEALVVLPGWQQAQCHQPGTNSLELSGTGVGTVLPDTNCNLLTAASLSSKLGANTVLSAVP